MKDINRNQFYIVTFTARKISTKAGFIRELKSAFDFPSHFGENLDAVYDCMCDLSWLQHTSYIVKIKNADRYIDRADSFNFKNGLDEVKDYWASQEETNEICFLVEY